MICSKWNRIEPNDIALQDFAHAVRESAAANDVPKLSALIKTIGKTEVRLKSIKWKINSTTYARLICDSFSVDQDDTPAGCLLLLLLLLPLLLLLLLLLIML